MACMLKLSDLTKLYSECLNQLGPSAPSRVNSTT